VNGQRVLSGRYALISHLARGGMADVYVGHDQLLDRRVAIKILHPEFAANEAFVERFRREAQAAANLNHVNIVDIYDWGRDQDVYFMVMELIQGRNLREELRSQGALDPRRVAEIAISVAAALGAAHERGLVHRDVKPANVLLTPEGEVKVTDFGIARAWDDSDQLTRTGAVIGTATYFSPEQAQGLSADGRSDIYALGVVMYELLTGVPPFVGESPVSVAYQHVREVAPPPSDLNPNIPDTLDAIVMRCLEKDPRKRYQTAGELSADLERFLAGQAPGSGPASEAPTRLMAPVGGPPLPPSATNEGLDEQPYHEPGRPDRSTLVIGILAAVALFGLGLVLLLRLLLPGGGGETVTIPDLRGQTRADAAATLEQLGLQVGNDQQVVDAEIATGLVAGTDPAADTEVSQGSTVSLLISAGSGNTTVPPLIGHTEDDARTLLSAAGLSARVTYEASDTFAQGTVIDQDPEAGRMVAVATVVDLVVSAGTSALTVPDVVNHTESDALLKLAEAGFQANQINVERQPSATVADGYVIEIQPAAGTVLPPDGVVTITISQGTVPTVVPGVVGQTPENARAALEERGFVVIFGDPIELDYGDPNDGKVMEQDPAAGSTVDYGSTVTLRLGQASQSLHVPNVLGQTPEAAQAQIEGAGLVYAEGDPLLLNHGDSQIGKVAAVNPAVGSTVSPGDTVTVRVGAEGAQVPNVASPCLAPAAAQGAIDTAGLIYQVVGVDYDLPVGDPCDGKVVEQSPAPYSSTHTLVALGSTVQVRTGKAMVYVPDVRAWTLKSQQPASPPPDPSTYNLAKSRQTLENLGFVVVVNSQACYLESLTHAPYDVYLDQDFVVDQSALGNPSTSLPALPYGSTITLFKGTSNSSAPPCQHPPTQ
jgi:beta-lactam-binding protein with PASTA domain/tRNA A-37 threonylcarbamoyl transferase component Bud32